MTDEKKSVSVDDRLTAEESKLRTALTTQRAEISSEVASRLAAMRAEAVRMAEHQQPQSRLLDRLLPRIPQLQLSILAAAFCASIVLWLVLRPASEDDLIMPVVTAPEVAVVQDLDLLEELEFLAWLEEESQGAG